jgi:hypothetical protein
VRGSSQAASSALIVAILHHTGTGAERAMDAAIGGAVALLIGVALVPSDPLPPLRAAERAVLGSVALALEGLVSLLSAGRPAEPAWTLAAAHDVHQRLAELTAARSSARLDSRVIPRRRALRAIVNAEDLRLARLHLLADAALGLVRAATAALEDREPPAASLEREIAALATTMRRLASTPHPWPPGLLSAVAEVAQRTTSQRADSSSIVAWSLHTTARDLQDLTSCLLGSGETVPLATSAAEPPRDYVPAVHPQARRSP